MYRKPCADFKLQESMLGYQISHRKGWQEDDRWATCDAFRKGSLPGWPSATFSGEGENHCTFVTCHESKDWCSTTYISHPYKCFLYTNAIHLNILVTMFPDPSCFPDQENYLCEVALWCPWVHLGMAQVRGDWWFLNKRDGRDGYNMSNMTPGSLTVPPWKITISRGN